MREELNLDTLTIGSTIIYKEQVYIGGIRCQVPDDMIGSYKITRSFRMQNGGELYVDLEHVSGPDKFKIMRFGELARRFDVVEKGDGEWIYAFLKDDKWIPMY